ncbi:MAG: Lrp/AsnC family transcriptional regulator, partial [Lachnospiraceae bacterium]|nr:Lrp/AsnC family transcriptional regulator [Lachnospiraceae bacterium]
EILTVIERNSRINIKELAVLLDSEETLIANEIQDMETEGVICGYHTLIDWSKTSGERVNALIEVKVSPQRGIGFDSIAERIYKYPEVNSVYLMSGGFDLMVIIEGRTMQDVAGFVTMKLSTLDTVLSTSTHFILKKYKDYGTVLAKKREDIREKMTP